jgi:hypothetical protein
MGEKRNACRISVRKPLGKPKRRWVNFFKTDLREIGWGWYGMD